MHCKTRSELNAWLAQLQAGQVDLSEACAILGVPFLSLPSHTLATALVYFVRALPQLSHAIAQWSARPRLDALEDRIVTELTLWLPNSQDKTRHNKDNIHAKKEKAKSNNSSSNDFNTASNSCTFPIRSLDSDSCHDSPDLSAIFSKANSAILNQQQPLQLRLQLDSSEEEEEKAIVNWVNLHDFIVPLSEGKASKHVLDQVCKLLGLPLFLESQFEMDLSSHCTSVYYLLICSSYWAIARMKCVENGILGLLEGARNSREKSGKAKNNSEGSANSNAMILEKSSCVDKAEEIREDSSAISLSRSNIANDHNNNVTLHKKTNNNQSICKSNSNNNNSANNTSSNAFSGTNRSTNDNSLQTLSNTNSPKKGGKLLRRDLLPSNSIDNKKELSSDTNTANNNFRNNNNNNVIERNSRSENERPNRLIRKIDPLEQGQPGALESPKKRMKTDDNHSFEQHSFTKINFARETKKQDPNNNRNHNAHENAETDTETGEIRQSPFLSAPPPGVLDRIDRAKTQRMYLVMKKPFEPGSLAREYVVLGSMGNVYTVVVSQTSSCDCPDHLRGNLCKHILFIYLKVLKVKKAHLLYQTSLLTSELKRIFDDFDYSPEEKGRNAIPMASESVREKYEQLLQEEKEGVPKRQSVAQQPIDASSQCPVCCEEFLSSKETIVFCQFGCGNNVHASCFAEWCKVQPSLPTCVICRSIWSEKVYEEKRKADLKAMKDAGTYFNLAQFQPQSGDHVGDTVCDVMEEDIEH